MANVLTLNYVIPLYYHDRVEDGGGERRRKL